jgi:phosphatidylethanolamine-binding protein (PEBP) family uncharacterized protein
LPAKGDKPHRYQFTLFAVDMDQLPVDENFGRGGGRRAALPYAGQGTFTAT